MVINLDVNVNCRARAAPRRRGSCTPGQDDSVGEAFGQARRREEDFHDHSIGRFDVDLRRIGVTVSTVGLRHLIRPNE